MHIQYIVQYTRVDTGYVVFKKKFLGENMIKKDKQNICYKGIEIFTPDN